MAAGRKVMSNAGVAAALVVLLVVAAASSVAGVCNVDTGSMVRNCRTYCTVGSTEASPSSACCGAVRGGDFHCLCQYRSVLPNDIDANRAMQIPGKCGYGAANC
ncbi:putative lipid-transfer protein [Hordeum vulgare]|nr:putative lipid-transfer protein [Hordeum vulgare]